MSLIVSVLHLDRRAVKALRITDLYSLHRVVYSLFDDVRSAEEKAAGHSSGILYADQGGDHEGRKILLLAHRMPASHVDGQYGRVVSRIVPEDFLNHERYRFQLIINPTKRDYASGKLVPIKDRASIAQWFIDRAPQSWGFSVSVEHLQIDRVEVQQFTDKAQRTITSARAHIQGQLTVTDPARFRHSFAHGIGRGRTFGCGLLRIVPLLTSPHSFV